jgi:hypothetical protein
MKTTFFALSCRSHWCCFFSCKLTMTSSFLGSSLFFSISLLITSLFVFFYSVCLFFSPLLILHLCFPFNVYYSLPGDTKKNLFLEHWNYVKLWNLSPNCNTRVYSIQLTTNKGNLIVVVFVELSLVELSCFWRKKNVNRIGATASRCKKEFSSKVTKSYKSWKIWRKNLHRWHVAVHSK